MNKKIMFIVALLAVSLLIPLTLARPWTYPKNNDYFQSFDTTFSMEIPFPTLVIDDTNPNRVTGTWTEEMLTYTITVGSETYVLGEDFTYEGIAVTIGIGAPVTLSGLGLPNGAKETHTRIKYMYDFGDGDGGIDGTLTMLALRTSGLTRPMNIRSLQGTGDLKNVIIQATQGAGFTHTGVVKGWPE